jgi:signal transduction histidine kinase
MKGDLTAVSTPGKGSTFILELPLAAPPVSEE